MTVVHTLMEKGFLIQRIGLKLQNVVGSANLHFRIDLIKLHEDHKNSTEYNPELFAAVNYRMKTPKMTNLIFSNGKMIITGGKSVEDVYVAFEYIYVIVCKYRKQ